MSFQNRSMLPEFGNLMSNPEFYKELISSECLANDDSQDFDETLYDLNELEEVFSDHILMGKRLQKSLYRGHIDDLDEDTDHPPIALTDFALKLFTKAAPNYGLDQLDMDYVSSVSEATRISPCAMILALMYLERLRIKNTDYLESVSPSGLFVVTMLVASKFLFENEEDIVTNQIWAETLNIDVKELNQLEQKFLSAIDWRLYVDSSEYFQYLSNVEKMVALRQSSFRGWLSYSDVCSILQDAHIRKALLVYIERILKVFALSTVSYAVTVLSVYSANLMVLSRCHVSSLCSKESPQNLIKSDFPKSLPILNNVDLESGENLLNSVLDDSSDILSNSPLNDQVIYNQKSYEFRNVYQSKNHQTPTAEKGPSILLSDLSSSFSSKPSSKTKESNYDFYVYDNTFFPGQVNNTFYKLQWWPAGFTNNCISVSVK